MLYVGNFQIHYMHTLANQYVTERDGVRNVFVFMCEWVLLSCSKVFQECI